MTIFAPLLIPLVAKQTNTTIPTFTKPNQVTMIFSMMFLHGGDAACNCNSSNQGGTQQYTVTNQVAGMLLWCKIQNTQFKILKPVVFSNLTLNKSH